MRTALEIRAAWLADLLSTALADRPRAESALRDFTPHPASHRRNIFWFDSPFMVSWAVALLNEPHDFLWQRMLEAVGRNKRQREHIDGVRAAPCRSAAVSDWKSLLAAAGEQLAANQMRLAGARHARGLDYASRKYLGAARSPENSRTCATV